MDIQWVVLVIVTLTLIISVLMLRTQRAEHKISKIRFGKDFAKSRLIMLKNELQDIADNPEKYKGRFREKNFGIFLIAPITSEFTNVSFVLSRTGLVVPLRLYNLVMEEGFFEDKLKIQKVIAEIEKFIKELG